MRGVARGWLLLILTIATGAAGDTVVTAHSTTGPAEICRFSAADATDPFRRWMGSPDVTCFASGSSLAFPPGLWNVFARSRTGISIDPTLIDSRSAPQALSFSLVEAATLRVQLPPAHTAVIYAPKHAIAYPASDSTIVPASEDLWLFVLSRNTIVSAIVIPPTTAATERTIDARSATTSKSLVASIHVPDADRSALRFAHGVELPHIRFAAGAKESETALPAPDALDGALVLFSEVHEGRGTLSLSGRGWLPYRREITVGPLSVTVVHDPIVARASAMLVVNWSTANDLAALDRSFGSCNPSNEAPKFELTVSSCTTPPPGKSGDEASCQVIRTEPLLVQTTFGSVTVGEVPPGSYRAELRYGKLPPVRVAATLQPLNQQPVFLQAAYLQAYGSLTRGEKPLGEEARIDFPADGVGFSPRDGSDYHAVLLGPIGLDAKIAVVTCKGERMVVLTDRPMPRSGRFDIDIPDNLLTISVTDTFTHALVPGAQVRFTVLSTRMPFRPVLTGLLSATGAQQKESDSAAPDDDLAGVFNMRAVPPVRQIRLEVSARGYRARSLEPFSMTKSEKKNVEVQLVPKNGSEAKIISSRPFENATLFWFSSTGVETERAELGADGTFSFEQPHYRGETMTLVSRSHPLWIIPAPAVERAKPLELRFPDAAPVRDAEVWLPGFPPRLMTLIGVAIGGLRVPSPALAMHMALRDGQPIISGAGPLLLPAIVESGPIDILRGPSLQGFAGGAPEALVMRPFVPSATVRLQPGSSKAVFGSK